jgi:hypothetical protein
MIYVDQVFTAQPENRQAARHGTQWCHLWCWPDTTENREKLHSIARAIGLRREYFQDRDSFPHYDLVPGLRTRAISYGAAEKNLREWITERREGSEAKGELRQANLF